MKNILKIVEEFGLKIPDGKEKDFEKAVLENYKTVADYEKQKEKLEKSEEAAKANDTALGDLKKQLEEFKDVDVSALNQRIKDLEGEKETLESDYQGKMADRDFRDVLNEAIAEAKGKNSKAIMALLDSETLKASKNQKEDVSAAIKALTEAEDSKMLFGEPEQQVIKTGSVIGEVTGGGADVADAQMRAVMGLPPIPNSTETK